MCGVPVHAAEAYLEKLIRKGHRVAVCEQVEDPAEAKKRGAKSVVQARGGAAGDARHPDRRCAAGSARFQLAGGIGPQRRGFRHRLAPTCPPASFRSRRWRGTRSPPNWRGFRRASCWSRMRCWRRKTVARAVQGAGHRRCRHLPASRFDSASGERALKTHYNMLSLDGLGAFSRAELSAAGALIAYLELTQKGAKVALQRMARVSPSHFMGIDAATRRNLELTQTLSGQRSGQPAGADRPHGDGGGRAAAWRRGWRRR